MDDMQKGNFGRFSGHFDHKNGISSKKKNTEQ